MGPVHPALQQLFDSLRQGVSVPVIVVTRGDPHASIVAIAQSGGAQVRSVSVLAHAVAITVTQEGAQRIARLPDVVSVQPDRPVLQLG